MYRTVRGAEAVGRIVRPSGRGVACDRGAQGLLASMGARVPSAGCALVFARGPWAVLWLGGGRAEWPRCRDKREGDPGRAEARGGRGRERCVALRPWVLGAALKKDLDVGVFLFQNSSSVPSYGLRRTTSVA